MAGGSENGSEEFKGICHIPWISYRRLHMIALLVLGLTLLVMSSLWLDFYNAAGTKGGNIVFNWSTSCNDRPPHDQATTIISILIATGSGIQILFTIAAMIYREDASHLTESLFGIFLLFWWIGILIGGTKPRNILAYVVPYPTGSGANCNLSYRTDNATLAVVILTILVQLIAPIVWAVQFWKDKQQQKRDKIRQQFVLTEPIELSFA